MFTDQKIHKFTLHCVSHWAANSVLKISVLRDQLQRPLRSTTSWARASCSAAALCKFVVASVLSFDDKFFWLTANQATLEEAPASDAKLTFAPKRP